MNGDLPEETPEVRSLPAARRNNEYKTTMKQCYAILFLAAAACSDPATPDVPEPSIRVETDCEDRTYELGESAAVTLTVTESHASGNYFDLEMNCRGAAVSGTIEGEPLVWDEPRSVFYGIANAASSSKVLHLTLTPQAGPSARQDMEVKVRITAADGSETEAGIPLRSVNSAEITAAARYSSQEPIEADEQLEIALTAHKENYGGDFDVTPEITRGQGFFIIDGKNCPAGKAFPIPANEEFEFQYQPLGTGWHEIRFLITDHVCSAEASVLNIRVQDHAGTLTPENGVYIYSRSVYYTSDAWQPEWEGQAEGVAVVSDRCRFLIAPKPVSGTWNGGYFTDVPGLTVLENWKDARLDFDGRKNTAALIRSLGTGVMHKVEIAQRCYDYDPEHPGKWYQPAAGQIYLVLQNMEEIQRCLELIGGRPLRENEYVIASTAAGESEVWAITRKNFRTLLFFISESDKQSYPVRDL